MALTGLSPPSPEVGDRQQSCPLDHSSFTLSGVGPLITKYQVLFDFSLGFQSLSVLPS